MSEANFHTAIQKSCSKILRWHHFVHWRKDIFSSHTEKPAE